MGNWGWFLLGGLLLPLGVLLTLLVMTVAAVKTMVRTKSTKSPTSMFGGLFNQNPDTSLRTVEPYGKEEKPDPLKKGVAVITFPSPKAQDPYDTFGKDVDEVVKNRERIDTVIVRVNSPGGSITAYGLLYSHMQRLRELEGVKLIVTVEQIAASGGYLMALPAHEIIAPEMSVIGSIGVYAGIPNFKELGDLLGVKMLEMTSGAFKRSVTPYSDPNDETAKGHMQGKLDEVYDKFRALVHKHRPQVQEESLNGDHWLGEEAMRRGLVDRIGTSNEVLIQLNLTQPLIYVETGGDSSKLQKLMSRFGMTAGESFGHIIAERLQTYLTEVNITK